MMAHYAVLRCALLISLVTASSCTTIEPHEITVSQDKLGSHVEGYARLGRFSGVVVLSSADGRSIWASTEDLCREDGRAFDPDSQFDPGSIAKPMLAVVVLSLVDERRLALDASIETYLPELTGTAYGQATLHQLLTHTAGIPDHDSVENFFETIAYEDISQRELLELFVNSEPLFEPGSSWSYSNFGYSLLAMAAERAAGAPYSRLLAERVFRKAGMTHSRHGDLGTESYRGCVRAFGGEIEQRVSSAAAASFGAGDVVVSVADLAKFIEALRDGQLISDASYRRMITAHAVVPGRNRGYGYGLEIYLGEQGETLAVGHGGLSVNAVSIMEFEPHSSGFAIALSNLRDSDDVINNVPPPLVRKLQLELREIAHGNRVEAPLPSALEEFRNDLRQSGFQAAFDRLNGRLANDPENWAFLPNEVVLLVFGDLWGNHENAIELVQFALTRDPQNWLLLETLGDVHLHRGDQAAAHRAYTQALALNPDRIYLQESVQSTR